MIQRKTQTEQFWREQFRVAPADVTRIYELILEAARPVSSERLALTLIEDACRQEEARLQADLSRGPAYQPRDSYQPGQQIGFPFLGYAWATVVETRPAHSPDHGDFVAIRVRFEGEASTREFASELRGEHKLNREEGEPAVWVPDDLLSPADLFERYGPLVEEQLAQSLLGHGEFLRSGDDWFLRGLLVDVNIGHLNIAEALIEVRGMPSTTQEVMDDLDLPVEVPADVRALSVKLAIQADARFTNVGDSGRDVWYLNRLMPEAVLSPPARLTLETAHYNRQHIASELLLVEPEIADEAEGIDLQVPSRPIYRTTVALTYPHWRSGTLPLNSRTVGLVPRPTERHTPVVLIDGQSGDRMQGWVVLPPAVLYGLAEWYKRYELPVGAFIKIERTRDPRVIQVDFEPQRLRRVWMRVAVVQGGRLSFQMRKLPAACQFDEQIALSDDGLQAIDALQAELMGQDEGLFELMLHVVPELVKLSPQGTVHAKTLYSAVNVLRRTPPGPVLALLSTEPCFVAMGGGYYTFDETRI